MFKACSVLLFIGVLFFLGNVNAKGVHLEEVEVTHKCVHDQMPDEFKYPAKGLKPIDIPYENHPLELAKNKQLLKKQSPNSGSPQIRFTFDSTRVATLGDAIGGTQRTCFSVGQTYIDQYNGSTLSCQSQDVLTTQYQTFLTTDLLPWLETTIESAIRVTAVPSPGIVISSPTPCGTQANAATVFAAQTIPNADLHVIVTARPTQSGVAAFAGFCQADTYGRPLLGYINFGLRAWNLVDAYKVQELRMTALHELTHVLGFSGSYFPSMRDPSTGLTYVTPPVGTMANGKSGLQTPTVLAEAQAQFNCSTLDGGQIEDEGGAGTAGSHWERSQYEGEYMVGVAYSNAVFSRMTMAWMYDSGWYYPDFSKAQTLRWGFRRGCSFVNSCTSPSRTTDFWGCAPSPTSGGNDGCSWDRNAMGPCSASSLMNGCTYYTSYSNRQCRWASTVWNTPGKVGTNDSACFGSTLNDLANFGCYQWLCRNQNQFFIVLNGVNYYCPFGTTTDSTISVSSGSKVGNIKCPRVSEQWCYNAPSPAQNPDLFTVSSVSPSSGKSSTSITISGTNFTSTMTVTVCDSSCTNPTVNAAKTTITCAVSADGDATADKYCAVVVSDTSGNKAGGAFTLSSDSGINLDSASWTSCAIATAAYGSPMDENVWKLREFRDQYLKQTPLGQSFISFYYTHSPMVAEFIAHNDFLRLCVRTLLWPVVSVVEMLV